MKTDRELLELAAKAGDIKGKWCSRSGAVMILTCDGLTDRYWNPLEDDGDALRLAVALQMDVSIFREHATAYYLNGCCDQINVHDRLDATRQAITRAAAAIGEGME